MAVTLLLPGCGASIAGSGVEKSESRVLPNIGITKVRLDCPGELEIHQGSPESLKITTDANLLPLVLNLVRGDVLTLSTAPGPTIEPTRTISFSLTVKDLKQFGLTGSGTTTIDRAASSDLKLMISGSGQITAHNVTVDNLMMEMSGTGRIDVDGHCQSENVTVSGTGRCGARGVSAQSASVNLSGVGTIDVNVAKKLDVTLAGPGSVHYWGSPVVSKTISGVGSVEAMH